MTPQQQRTIYDWALIHEYAKQKVSAEMMVEVQKMDDALEQFIHDPDMPAEVQRFAKAMADPGCGKCWVSSKIGCNHPECNVKIKEWFDAREALITYGLQLDRSALAAVR